MAAILYFPHNGTLTPNESGKVNKMNEDKIQLSMK
jgi:hypothetical protein